MQPAAGLCLLSILLTNCSQQTVLTTTGSGGSTDQDALIVWWERGYYAQEDEAIETVIKQWETETGHTVELSLLDQDVILKETRNALAQGQVPDIVFSMEAERTLIPQWASQGLLADVTDIVEPMKSSLNPAALQSIAHGSSAESNGPLYSVPLKQQTVHIHYWRDLLAEAGLNEADIPRDWDGFWAFWQQAQETLHALGRTDIHALGVSMSSETSDTYTTFHQVLEAYDIEVVDASGNLVITEPEMRSQLIAALDWYTSLYKDGFVPSDAVDWGDIDNNVAFLNRNLLMVVNPTLSIPGSQREDEAVYFDQLATLEFPTEPDGDPPTYITNTLQLIVLEASSKQEMAKDFIAYLMQPDNLSPYLEGSLGRFFPVDTVLAEKPFWTNPADPHVFAGAQQLTSSRLRPGYYTLNHAYSGVDIENIWGQAIERILVDGVSPEAGADWAIDSIQVTFNHWE